ncbi:MAG TPA: hypothetical protein VMR92_07680 [Gemmatimonadales bacterium]|nr:hypothetical protein [Gemmatimonadales bacterium]
MGLSFVCPNCRKRVDPMSINAAMSPTTKLWQHRDCGVAESDGKGKDPEPPQAERRKQPRGNR